MRDSDTDEDAPVAAVAGVQAGPGDTTDPGPAADPDPLRTGVALGDTYAAGGMTAALDVERQRHAREAFARLGDGSKNSFRRRHDIRVIDDPWPPAALHELLGPDA